MRYGTNCDNLLFFKDYFSGLFGQYMVTPASEALFVINGRSRTVNCEIGAVNHPSAVVWTTLKFH